ncbi:MAG: DNA-protecting protein DprA [Planctomycetaceae bacterium]|nr:DNA-protecting protein DprA [Planctomycetaceae bacterium]
MNSDSNPTHERLATLALHLTHGVGPRIYQTLLNEFGDSTRILAAPLQQLIAVPGVGSTVARKIVAATIDARAEREWLECSQANLQILDRSQVDYPSLLTEIPDPPPILFVRGQLLPADRVSIAIVGTRRASCYGIQQAEALAVGLAQAGVTVVSGLARGIDAAAHRGALQAGGRTIGVLASGLAEIYPPEHDNLADQISVQGALLTESPLRTRPKRGQFPRRNRIISGMTLGVIVVEASGRSGALVTVKHAVEQNREVFAVPGRVDQEYARGCHRLIRDGAKLVESVDDVLEELGPLSTAPTRPAVSDSHPAAVIRLSDLERTVLQTVGRDPTSVDQVIESCRNAQPNLSVSRVLSALSILEMRRLIDRLSGSVVVRR